RSANIVDYYAYRGQRLEKCGPERIIHFRFPAPRDPYTSGLSPLRACFEQAAQAGRYAAMKQAIYDNSGMPSVLISPGGPSGGDERERLENEWKARFQRGGQGQALICQDNFKVQILSHSMGDLAALADMKATKEDI